MTKFASFVIRHSSITPRIMPWLFGFILVVVISVWFARERALRSAQKRVIHILETIAAGDNPQSFHIEAPLAALSPKLEAVEDEKAHLRQQRRLAEANLQIILSSMQDGVLVADSRRTVRLVNPSLRKLLAARGVDTSGAVEKADLIALARGSFEKAAPPEPQPPSPQPERASRRS